MRGIVLFILKFLFLVFLIGVFIFIWKTLPLISGYGAKVVCSGVFVAGRKPEEVERYDLRRWPLNMASYVVDRTDSSVTGRVLGLAETRAIYRRGLGATLVNGISEEELRRQNIVHPVPPPIDPDTVDWPLGDRLPREDVTSMGDPSQAERGFAARRVVQPTGKTLARMVSIRQENGADGGQENGPDGRTSGRRPDTVLLQRALGMAFGDGAFPVTGTRALIVIHHGRIVAERYAPGFDRHSRLIGWSMTKGITSALTGILVKEGKLDIRQTAAIPEWKDDERGRIRIQDLLHMNSGLWWWEFYGAPGDCTNMLFREKSMGEYAATVSLRHMPGKVFNYSSGTANILSFILRRAVGDEEYYRWPYEQLFYKIGMYNAVLEADANGTFVGSSYCYATARDWARFGLLYLHNGRWNGEAILPEGWVSFTRQGQDYGAMWWLNRGEPSRRRHPGLPADCYSCEGYEGQYIWVIPSKDMVVVRLACETGDRLDPDAFMPPLLAALR